MTKFTLPPEPSVADIVSALRGSPGPVIMAAQRAADYLEALHNAATIAKSCLNVGNVGTANEVLTKTLEVVGK